jgi:hypothetical protein
MKFIRKFFWFEDMINNLWHLVKNNCWWINKRCMSIRVGLRKTISTTKSILTRWRQTYFFGTISNNCCNNIRIISEAGNRKKWKVHVRHYSYVTLGILELLNRFPKNLPLNSFPFVLNPEFQCQKQQSYMAIYMRASNGFPHTN